MTLDTTFASGTGANGEIYDIIEDVDGKMYIGNKHTLYDGHAVHQINRIFADGAYDSTFVAPNWIYNPANGNIIYSICLYNRNIYVAGRFTYDAGVYSHGYIQRLNYDGSINYQFGVGGSLGFDNVSWQIDIFPFLPNKELGATENGVIKNVEIPVIFGTAVDSSKCVLNAKYPIGYTWKGFTIDTIIVIMTQRAGSPDVTPKIFFGTDISTTGTAVITSPSNVTSYTAVTKISSFNNATIGKGNMIWLTFSAVSVKPENIEIEIIGH